MKACVVGAGAIGGLIAAYLARAGHDVSAIARGAHLAAMCERGLTLRKGTDAFTVRVPASDDPELFGVQDVVFITLKAHGIGPMLTRLRPLIGSATVVVPAINGIPWWYFHGEGGRFAGSAIECVDPGGAMLAALEPSHILGCTVLAAANVADPGFVVQTTATAGFTLGELDGSASARAQRIVAAMNAAGMKADLTPRIRDAVWWKLLGNLAFNPVAALGCARTDQIFTEPRAIDLIRAVMTEAIAVGHALGISFPVTVEQRIEVARNLGAFKSSMLQDVEQGRPIEVEAIVGVVVELAHRLGVPTPAVDAVYALARLRNATLVSGSSRAARQFPDGMLNDR